MRREAARLAQRGRGQLNAAALEASRARYQRRAQLHASLAINYPSELPIAAHVEEIRRLLGQHPVVIVAGETGSGKTTQLPKICLEAGLGIAGSIAHTQPRRLAARTVAARIASELATPLGDAVGYAVRFSDQTAEQTLVKLLTDGLLLTEIRGDRFLDAYDAIIVDEAHERSLNIDFLLGYLRRLLQRRRDLKVIVTSATIDVERFSDYFGGAPVVQVSGRGYPVTIRHLPDEEAAQAVEPEERLCTAVEQIANSPGARDILVFQTGEREIFESARALRAHFGEQFDVLPLYARLRAADQNRVFSTGGRRRIVLATNVAETSLTVPNIGFVIDPGYARLNRYSYRSKLTRLPVEPISQASANQRAGRCGRVAPGTCLRLYSEADFQSRTAFTEPEIRRVNLASVVLQMRAFALGDIERFGFIEPPEPGAIRDAIRLLHELGALDGERLTPMGRAMARLPVDPRLARMLVGARDTGALRELLVIVSALSIQDPRERPREAQEAADRKHAQWVDENSDFLTWIRLWDWLINLHENSTRSGERKAHEANFLNHMRIREWRELHRQLVLTVRELGWRINTVAAGSAEVHRAVLAGSLSLVGIHDEKGVYLGARGTKFRVFPGSTLRGKSVRWLVAAEIAETTQIYARCVGPVEPGWIEQLSGHLVTRQHTEPHWAAKRGEARTWETVRLYGLPLAERRSVRLAPLDPLLAREMLIRDGLVAGGVPVALKRQVDFIDRNLAEQRAVLDLETRSRRRDLMISEAEICAFYAQRLPAEVVDGVSLSRWWRGLDAAARAPLYLDRDSLLRATTEGLGEDQYPASVRIGALDLKVKYRFAPGELDDGVNVLVGEGVLSGVVPELLDWSVPGYFGRVCESWLRTLPKQKRRLLSPIADRVEAIAGYLLHPSRYRQGRLTLALNDALTALYGLAVDEADWDRSRVEPNCLVNIVVRDAAGRLLRQGRDLEPLMAVPGTAEMAADDGPVREDLRQFPAEGLHRSVTVRRGGAQVLLYPALVERGQGVDLVYRPDAVSAALDNRRGYARLALLANADTARFMKKELAREKTLALHFASLGDADTLREEVLLASAWQCFFEARPLPESASAFAERMRAEGGGLLAVFRLVVKALGDTLSARFDLVRLLDTTTSPAFNPAVADVRALLARLVPANVLSITPADRLAELPRYLAGLHYRVANLQGRVAKDAELVRQMRAFESRLDRYRQHRLADPAQVLELERQVEETRVGIFAQPLARKGQGSAVRLDRALETAERAVGLR
ncbi:MAG: ATP-dependent RNA helicase HrpA [Pseudomonadales bacterium]